jgi:hypothetical protein
MKHAYWLALAALAAGIAVAQEHERPDPADPQAPVTPVPYKSAFEGYRGLEEPKPTPWRVANDEAARVGGHIGILREQAKSEERK